MRTHAGTPSSVSDVQGADPDEERVARRLHQALDFIYVSFDRLIPYDRIGLSLVDPKDGSFRQVWQRAARPELLLPEGYNARRGVGSLGRVLVGGAPRILNDLVAYLAANPHSTPTRLLVERGIRSSLTCPLFRDGTPFGVLFFSSSEIGAYSSGHIDSFVALAAEVAAIVGPGQAEVALGDVFARLAIQLHRVHQENQIAEQIARRVHDRVTLDDVMSDISDAVDSIIPFDRVELALFEEASCTLTPRWARTRHGPVLLGDGQPSQISDTSLGPVAASGRPRILNDLVRHLTENPSSTSSGPLVQEGMRSSLTCPVTRRGSTTGFLFFSSTQANAYSPAHLATYQRIASEVALVIERAREHDHLDRERRISDSLLTELLPTQVLQPLRQRRDLVARYIADAGVLFVDIQGFTSWSMRAEPDHVVGTLDRLFREFDRCCDAHGVQKLRTIGDAYMAVSGVDHTMEDHFSALACAASDMVVAASGALDPVGQPIVVRAGIACGSVVAGVLGGRVPHFDVWGPCVNLAARLQAIAPGQHLCVDAASAQCLDGRFSLVPVGPQQLKGVGTIEVLLVER